MYGLIQYLGNEIYDLPAKMINTESISNIEVDRETISESIGLSDINDRCIFEGDIVKYRNQDKELTAVVVFKHSAFCLVPIEQYERYKSGLKANIISIKFPNIEVIGNIYDSNL